VKKARMNLLENTSRILGRSEGPGGVEPQETTLEDQETKCRSQGVFDGTCFSHSIVRSKQMKA
jgi:hypothetical protein